MRILISLSLCFYSFLSFATPNTLPFFEGPFSRIQAEADFSGKPFLLYFYQNDCSNCQYWEDGPFQDPQLISFLQSNFLITKKNLLTMEGNQLSQELGIEYAGSLVIFTPEGDVLVSIQSPLSSAQLINLLTDHTSAASFDQQTPHFATSSWNQEKNSSSPVERRILPSVSNDFHKRVDDGFGERENVFSHKRSVNYPLEAKSWYENQVATIPSKNARISSTFRSSRLSVPPSHASRYIQSRPQRKEARSEITFKKFYGKSAMARGIQHLRKVGYTSLRIYSRGWSSQGEKIYIVAILPSQG